MGYRRHWCGVRILLCTFIVALYFHRRRHCHHLHHHRRHQHHHTRSPPPQITSLEVSGRGSTACTVGETCAFSISPAPGVSFPPSFFQGLTFEARLVGPAIVNVQVHPSEDSYRL
jgi:hypothetical protein